MNVLAEIKFMIYVLECIRSSHKRVVEFRSFYATRRHKQKADYCGNLESLENKQKSLNFISMKRTIYKGMNCFCSRCNRRIIHEVPFHCELTMVLPSDFHLQQHLRNPVNSIWKRKVR